MSISIPSKLIAKYLVYGILYSNIPYIISCIISLNKKQSILRVLLCMTCLWHRGEEGGKIIVLERKLKQARCLPARVIEWINTRLMFNALGVDRQWCKNYPDWLSWYNALWTHMVSNKLWPVKPTLCYCMSRNPQVFLMVVPLPTICIF